MPLGRTAAASWGPSAGSLPSSGGASGAAPGERPPRPDQRSCPVMPAPWGALPTELLALVFRQLSSVANAEAGERGVELGEAARLVAALGANREWRAAALQELCLRVRVADMGQLRHASRLLSSLRCSGLALPCLAGKPLAAQAAAQEFTLGLLSDAVFLRRSGASLAALLGVPLTLVASGALAGSPLPALRHLSLALEPLCQRDCFQAAASLRRSCFPAGLHTVELAASLLVAGLTAEQLPQRLCRLSLTADQQGSLTVGSGALAACPAITARASGTATLLLEQLTVGGGRGCRQLSVRARWAVLSAGGSAPFVGVLAGGGGVEAALLSWLRCLHTVLARSALQRLELVACEVLSYCQSTGRLAKLRLPLWQNPGIVQVAAFGLEARCAWPVPGLPPAYFSLVVTRHKA